MNKQQARVEQMAAFFEEGRDLWTGQPLTWEDYLDWLELQNEMTLAQDHMTARRLAALMRGSTNGKQPCTCTAISQKKPGP